MTKNRRLKYIVIFAFYFSLSIFLSWRCLDLVPQAAVVLLSWEALKEFWITGEILC